MKKNIKSKRLVKSSSEKQYKTFDEVKIGDTAIDFNDEKSKVIDKGTFEEMCDSYGDNSISDYGLEESAEDDAIVVEYDNGSEIVWLYDDSGALVEKSELSNSRKLIKSSKRKPIVSAPRSDDGQLEFDFDENDEADIVEEKENERQALREKYADVIALLDSEKEPEEILEDLFEELVPASGEAETVAGEMVRACMRVIYRYFNDGDCFLTGEPSGSGYGAATVIPALMYLIEKVPPLYSMIDEMVRNYSEYVDEE